MVRSTPPPSAEHWARQSLLDLVSAHTPAGREADNLPVLLPLLEALGAAVEVREAAPGRVNILATWGEPRVAFTTHLDVVPGELPVREVDGVIHGRGACDAKGQIVAQLGAIRQLRAEGLEGFAWLGVCGEETDSLGAREALAWKGRFQGCRALINGEPTELKCGTGQRGLLHLKLCCRGKAAHSGSPELGRSATFALLDWIEALRREPDAQDPELGPEVWNLGLMQGGTAPNVIPDAAEAQLLVRTVPDSGFLARVESARPSDSRLDLLLEEPWDRYPALPGFEMAPMPFGSDAPQLRGLVPDRTVVLAGPGSIRVAHTDHEHLALSDLMAGIDLNQRLARYFLGHRP